MRGFWYWFRDKCLIFYIFTRLLITYKIVNYYSIVKGEFLEKEGSEKDSWSGENRFIWQQNEGFLHKKTTLFQEWFKL